jgi:hypothetical protein
MATFVGTLLIVILSCLAMGIGLLLSGRPLAGGCGSALPGGARCAGCPKRKCHAKNERKTLEESTDAEINAG